MPDGKVAGPFKYRMSSVARKIEGKWKVVHAHGSAREAVAPAPAPSTASK
jgi:hypothetical protein